MTAPARETGTSLRRLATLCVGASAAEWYDFFLYATAAALVFPAAFFAPLGPTAAVLASFLTFALAFVARPLGGIVFGVIGDRLGRRAALAGGTVAMGVATTLIGLLPPYAVLGVAAPVLLVVLRLVQGLALGGQWAGSVLLLTEQAPPGRRGLHGAVAQLGSPVGGIVSTGLLLLFAEVLSPAAFAAWGWRVPFLVSVLFVALGLYLRRRLEDTPAFRRLAAGEGRSRTPVLEVLRRNPGQVLLAAGVFVAASASLWVFVSYLLTYLPSLGVSRPTALLLVTVTQAAQIPAILGAAAVSDRVGRRPTYLVAALALAVWAVPAFALIDTGSPGAIAVALGVVHLVLGAMYGPLAALFTEMFATRVRYSGASLGYQLGTVLGGGLAPTIATALAAATGGSTAVAGYLVAVSLVTLVAAALVGDRSGRALGPDRALDTDTDTDPDPDPDPNPGVDARAVPGAT